MGVACGRRRADVFVRKCGHGSDGNVDDESVIELVTTMLPSLQLIVVFCCSGSFNAPQTALRHAQHKYS